MIIGVGVYLILLMLILNFFLGVKSNEIRKENYNLKPLDLKKSGINATLFDELRKCDEENAEFTQAILKCDYDNAIEEFWDSIQTKLNCMDMSGIRMEDIYAGLEKHKLKMIKRGNIFKG
ncbi:hypothetical protein [Clostridium isatidis]|uniref:hypothetical protein n=1 Tax=Clostridium isatidis TaxID=182773 RepID=UPI003AAC19DC